MIEDEAIRKTVEDVFPNASVEQGFKWRGVMVEILSNRRAGFDRPINPTRARMLAVYNKHLHTTIRAHN